MSSLPRPTIECEQQHACFPVSNLGAALAFYRDRLGFAVDFTWGEPAHFAGVSLGRMQMFLQERAPVAVGSAVTFVVGDVDALFAFHRANDVPIDVDIGDRDYGIRDYGVRDPDGNTLSFGQHLHNMGPRMVIERVELPVRLERRLVALLHDLAAHKRMSITQLLEETLLHTLDGVGPHTDAQLRRIALLKKTHGIDYDTHASYRFTEA
jgi:catechol 2,3-dioxygenase-like lactoylglutathione lyase family enzyme